MVAGGDRLSPPERVIAALTVLVVAINQGLGIILKILDA